MKYFSRFIILLLASVAVLSCKREGSGVTAPPDVSDTTTFVDSVDFSPKVGMSVITGQVFDATLEPDHLLANAYVILDSPLYGAKTDSEGKFTLYSPPGIHTIFCEKPSYAKVNVVKINVPQQGLGTDTVKVPIIRTALIPSYQPVNVKFTSGYDNHHLPITIVTCDRKLIDPRQIPPYHLIMRVYKSDPITHPPIELETIVYGGSVLMAKGGDVVSLSFSISLGDIQAKLKLKKGDAYYFTFAFASGQWTIGMSDVGADHKFRITSTGLESEPIKVVAP